MLTDTNVGYIFLDGTSLASQFHAFTPCSGAKTLILHGGAAPLFQPEKLPLSFTSLELKCAYAKGIGPSHIKEKNSSILAASASLRAWNITLYLGFSSVISCPSGPFHCVVCFPSALQMMCPLWLMGSM